MVATSLINELMKSQFDSYEDSSLQLILRQVLNIINTTTESFPELAKKTNPNTSPEVVKLKQLFELIKTSITIWNANILPLFSAGRSPNFLESTKLLLDIRSMLGKMNPPQASRVPEHVFLEKLIKYLRKKNIPQYNQPLKDAESLHQQIESLIEVLRQQQHLFGSKLHEEERAQLLDEAITCITNLQNLNLSLFKQRSLASLVIETLSINFFPKHPASYFFLEKIMELLTVIPRDLKTLVPFFNPEFLPTLLRILNPFSFFQGKTLVLVDAKTFVFEIKTGVTVVKTLYFQKEFGSILDKCHGYLRSISRRYLAKTLAVPVLKPTTTSVKLQALERDEQAKEKCLLSFVEHEKCAIAKKISTRTGVLKAEDLNADTTTLKSLKQEIECFINQVLEAHSQSYTRETLINLIQKYPALYQQYKEDSENGLDIGYLCETLPDAISAGTEGFYAMRTNNIPVQIELLRYVEEVLLPFKSDVQMIQAELNDRALTERELTDSTSSMLKIFQLSPESPPRKELANRPSSASEISILNWTRNFHSVLPLSSESSYSDVSQFCPLSPRPSRTNDSDETSQSRSPHSSQSRTTSSSLTSPFRSLYSSQSETSDSDLTSQFRSLYSSQSGTTDSDTTSQIKSPYSWVNAFR